MIFVACPTRSYRPRRTYHSSSSRSNSIRKDTYREYHNYSPSPREEYSSEKLKGICKDKKLTLREKLYNLDNLVGLKEDSKKLREVVSRIKELYESNNRSNPELELINQIERYYSKRISSIDNNISKYKIEAEATERRSVIERSNKNIDFENALEAVESSRRWYNRKSTKREIDEKLEFLKNAKIEYNKEYIFALGKYREKLESNLSPLVLNLKELELERDTYVSKVKNRSLKEEEYERVMAQLGGK